MTTPYIDILLLTAIIVFIVDLSGFTDTWKSALARVLHVRAVRPLPPFDCSLCLTFWAGVIYAIVCGCFSLGVLAYVCACAFLTVPLGGLFRAIYELLTRLLTWKN